MIVSRTCSRRSARPPSPTVNMSFDKAIKENVQAADLFKSTFQAPLPMSGSATSKLSDLPVGLDTSTARGSNRELAITSWNVQCHHYLSHVAYTKKTNIQDQPDAGTSRSRSPVRITLLADGALAQVVARMTSLNNILRREFLKFNGRYIGNNAAVYTSLPQQYNVRSSSYPEDVAAGIARAYDEGRLTTDPPSRVVPDSDTGEQALPRRGRRNTPPSQEERMLDATPPAKKNSALVMPLRSVRTVTMAFKGYRESKPPKSSSMIAIESYATSSDRAATQPYIAVTRGVLARDVSAIQEIVAYAASYNVSHVDTAPSLRGLLYSYPRSKDVWTFDSYDGRFVRRQDRPTRKFEQHYIRQVPEADRIRIRVAAVSLPAFASHLKNLDRGMAAEGGGGVSLTSMDSDWTAIPMSSDMIGQPWLNV